MLDFNDAAPLRILDPAEWDHRLERLRTALRSQASDLVREVFPRARIQAHEARIGSIDGEPGESLSISLRPDDAGLWFDHATGEKGDLIDLWKATQGIPEFARAVDDLERWCGLSTKPRWSSPVYKVAEKRKLEASRDPPVDHRLGPPTKSYHYYSADGVILGIVRRYELDQIDPSTGKRKKTFLQFNAQGEPKSPDPRPLYRLQQIRTASTVVLVEGEKCADALAALGIEATSAMGGAKTLLEKTDFTPLAGKRVILWPDNDPQGRAYMERVEPVLLSLGCDTSHVSIPSTKPPKWDAADAVEEGADVASMLTGVKAERPKVPIYSRRELRELKRPEWLIDEVLVEASVVTLYGPSGSLKSFVAIDIAMSVATGLNWHGRDIKQGAVIYVTGEGRAQIDNRLEAWERLHEYRGDAPIFVVPLGIDVSTPEWVGHLIQAIEQVSQAPPAMIWLDTLARTFGSGDENSQKDMNAYIAGADRLRDRFGCVVGIIHHTGKEDTRGLRGSSALYAAMDTVIRTDRKAGKMLVTLKNQQPHGKQKDAAEFEDITLEAQVVKLGAVDAKGRPLTSLGLVLGESEPTQEEGETAARAASGSRPQGANQTAILAALRKAGNEPLGLTRLAAMIRKDNTTVLQAVRPLIEKGLIHEVGEGGARRWTLA